MTASDDEARTAAPLLIERVFRASIDDVWALWTTKEGLESWWGPEGFATEVRSIDLRPGGALHYVMTATAPEHVAFMKQAGMPLSTAAMLTYTIVEPFKRLAYAHRVDFVPDVAPYDVDTAVEFFADAETVRMVLSLGAMHADEWTERAAMGWTSQLARLEAVLSGKA